MVEAITSRWWMFLAQGVAMIILAIITISQPGMFIQIIGAYAIIDGALKIVSSLNNKDKDENRWIPLVTGVLGVIVGLYVFANPVNAIIVISYAIALWAIVVGVLLVIWSVRLRELLSEYWLLLILGVLSVIFGLLVFNNVLAGFLSLAWIFVVYMIAGGIMAILLGFRIKELGERLLARR